MKKIAYLLPTICLVVVSLSAKADTLKLVSANGVDGPYSMQINGTPVELFCMDDQRTVSVGESWAVTVNSGADYFTTNKSSTDFKYEEEAYILSQETASNHDTIQQALWKIFDSSDYLSPVSAAEGLVKAAYNFDYTTAFLSGYDFYIPVAPSGRHSKDPSDWDGNGIPQEFIGQNPDPAPAPTPEPSTLALFGSGLIGMAGMARRKLSRA